MIYVFLRRRQRGAAIVAAESGSKIYSDCIKSGIRVIERRWYWVLAEIFLHFSSKTNRKTHTVLCQIRRSDIILMSIILKVWNGHLE